MGSNVYLPELLPACALSPSGVYFVENGQSIWLYVGVEVDSALVQEFFGTRCPSLDLHLWNPRIAAILNQIRMDKPQGHPHLPLRIAVPGTREEGILHSVVTVEDRVGALGGYSDFVIDLHEEVLKQLQGMT